MCIKRNVDTQIENWVASLDNKYCLDARYILRCANQSQLAGSVFGALTDVRACAYNFMSRRVCFANLALWILSKIASDI